MVAMAAVKIQAARARWAPEWGVSPEGIRTLVLSDAVEFHDALLRYVAESGEDLGLLPADMADVVHTGVIVPGQHEAEGEEAPVRGLTRARTRTRARAHTHAQTQAQAQVLKLSS